MPIYQFINNDTNEEFDLIMTIAERDEFVKNNPACIQQFTSLNIGDPVRLGITKPPPEFMRGVIGRMQDSIPKNRLKDTTKFQVPKEI
jgi:hypothetical protein